MKIELLPKDIEKAFLNTNFGHVSTQDVIFDTLLKRATGFHAGFTAECITTELGLTTKKTSNLTKKGKTYLYQQVKDRIAGRCECCGKIKSLVLCEECMQDVVMVATEDRGKEYYEE